MSYSCDPGRPSEQLQAEHLAKWGQTPTPRATVPTTEAPQPPKGHVHQNLPPAPPVAPVVEEKRLDPAEFDKTGRLPLAALPKDELVKLAEANGITVTKDSSRESVVAALNEKKITDVAVGK